MNLASLIAWRVDSGGDGLAGHKESEGGHDGGSELHIEEFWGWSFGSKAV